MRHGEEAARITPLRTVEEKNGSKLVLQALSTGGGLSPRGTERGVRIKRRDANGVLQIITVKHDDLLKPDDIVYVKESLF